MKPIKFTVNRAEVTAMRLLISEDITRPDIHGIHFDVSPERILMIATDGRRLGILRELKGEPTGTIRFSAACNSLDMFPRGKECNVDIEVYETTVRFSYQRMTAEEDLIAGIFPNWREAVPHDPVKPCDIHLNADYVQSFRQIAAAIYPDKIPSVHLLMHASPLNQVSVLFGNSDQRFYGIVMPMRGTEPIVIPNWVANLLYE